MWKKRGKGDNKNNNKRPERKISVQDISGYIPFTKVWSPNGGGGGGVNLATFCTMNKTHNKEVRFCDDTCKFLTHSSPLMLQKSMVSNGKCFPLQLLVQHNVLREIVTVRESILGWSKVLKAKLKFSSSQLNKFSRLRTFLQLSPVDLREYFWTKSSWYDRRHWEWSAEAPIQHQTQS